MVKDRYPAVITAALTQVQQYLFRAVAQGFQQKLEYFLCSTAFELAALPMHNDPR